MHRGVWRLSLLVGLVSGGLTANKIVPSKWWQPDLSLCDYILGLVVVLIALIGATAAVLFIAWVWAGFAPDEAVPSDGAENADSSSFRAHVATAVFSVLISVLVFSFFFTDQGGGTSHSTESISIVLTALTAILAALAIFLGTVGVIGYAAIRSEVRKVARHHMQNFLSMKYDNIPLAETQNVPEEDINSIDEETDEISKSLDDDEKEDEK